MKTCPTCGRRPSERHDWDASRGANTGSCIDPIHDRADACEELHEALSVLLSVTLDTLEVECPHCEHIEPGHEGHCPINLARYALGVGIPAPSQPEEQG